MKYYEHIYEYLLYISYMMYIFIIFGVTKYAPEYLNSLKNIIKVYISLILIIKFNPFNFKERKLREFDNRLVFSAAIFLLLSTSMITFIENYLKKYILNIIDY